MGKFIRVRSARGPKTEYEISEAAYKARPGAYVRVGSGVKPVEKSTQVARSVAKSAGKETKA